jgi:hypothetical protein
MTSRPVKRVLPHPLHDTDTAIRPPAQNLFPEGSGFLHIFPVRRGFGCKLAVSLPVLCKQFYSWFFLHVTAFAV